jgi:hypothetical protein
LALLTQRRKFFSLISLISLCISLKRISNLEERVDERGNRARLREHD